LYLPASTIVIVPCDITSGRAAILHALRARPQCCSLTEPGSRMPLDRFAHDHPALAAL
jgi:hypothetical protein